MPYLGGSSPCPAARLVARAPAGTNALGAGTGGGRRQPEYRVADRGRGEVPPGDERLEIGRGHHVRLPGGATVGRAILNLAPSELRNAPWYSSPVARAPTIFVYVFPYNIRYSQSPATVPTLGEIREIPWFFALPSTPIPWTWRAVRNGFPRIADSP